MFGFFFFSPFPLSSASLSSSPFRFPTGRGFLFLFFVCLLAFHDGRFSLLSFFLLLNMFQSIKKNFVQKKKWYCVLLLFFEELRICSGQLPSLHITRMQHRPIENVSNRLFHVVAHHDSFSTSFLRECFENASQLLYALFSSCIRTSKNKNNNTSTSLFNKTNNLLNLPV